MYTSVHSCNWFWCFLGFGGFASANGGKFDQFLSKRGSHIYSAVFLVTIFNCHLVHSLNILYKVGSSLILLVSSIIWVYTPCNSIHGKISHCVHVEGGVRVDLHVTGDDVDTYPGLRSSTNGSQFGDNRPALGGTWAPLCTA
jgi:hypothetical protein